MAARLGFLLPLPRTATHSSVHRAMSSLLHHLFWGRRAVSRRGKEVREGAAARMTRRGEAAHTSACRPLHRRLGSSLEGHRHRADTHLRVGTAGTSLLHALVRQLPSSPLPHTNTRFRASPPDSILSKPKQPILLATCGDSLPSRPGARSAVLPFPFQTGRLARLTGPSRAGRGLVDLGDREGWRSSCRCWLYMGR